MIDLHTHSTISDGNLNPKDLILYAASKKVEILALTDHDTTGGLAEAAGAAAEQGITFVPGIELNIEWTSGEFHLLGLGLKTIAPPLSDITDMLQESRIARNYQIMEKMQKDGFDVSYDELAGFTHSGCIGRPHIAQYLVEKRIVKTRQQAFDRFIAKGRPYFAERTGCNLDQAVAAIRECGGVPVLAHPLSLYVSWGKLEPLLAELKERGVAGIEAYHPGARIADGLRLENLARRFGFIVTAGSDFHGEGVRADRRIGHACGNEKIDGRFWYEELKPLLDSMA